MTASIPIFSPMVRVLDASGDPVASGTVEFYSAGTSTPKTVYADADLTIELGTTVSTDAGGYPVTSGNARTLVYTGTSAFKMIVKDSAGATLVTHDNVPGAVVVPDAETSALSETPIVSKTTNYTVVAGDQGKLLNCNCTSGAFAITLLSAVTAGDGFEVTIRHVGTANQVTVRSSGTETISHSGKASYSVALKSYGQSLCFVSDGANWLVKASSPPRMLDGVPFFTVADRLTATPSSPTPGARYIITGSPTGAWSTLSFTSGQIAEADGNGSWFAYTPADGWTAYVEDENVITQYRDSTWTDLSNVTAPAATYLGRALFRDEKSTNTNGGTPTNTAWTKSDINTTVNNSITGLSLASSVLTFTGLTGRFLIRATKSFYATQETQIRLRDTTNNTTFGVSPQVYASSYTSGTGPASILAGASPTVFGVLNLDGTTTNVELQYYVTNNPASGLGRVRNVSGENEVYAQIEVLDLSAQQGPAGTQGTQGVDGLDAAYPYQWSTATSGDPGSGKVLGNNATIASITQLNISETDSAGGSMAAVIATWDDSTSSNRATVKISKEGATQNFHAFRITGAGTDAGSYWTFPVTYIATSGTISNGNDCAVVVIEKGDKGDTGAAGVTGSTTFTFSTTTADSDPGSGTLRLNNATASSATAAYIDNNNSGGSDISAWLDSFDDTGESAFRGHLHLYDSSSPTTVFRIYKVTGSVTDGTGYRKLVLDHVAGAGTYTNGNTIIAAWLPRGATGVGDTTGAASSTDNAIVRFDGTGGKTLQNSAVTIDDSGNVTGAASYNHMLPHRNPMAYGAAGDGSTNDATAVESAITAALTLGGIVVIDRPHKITSRITVTPTATAQQIKIVFAGAGRIIYNPDSAAGGGLYFDGTTGSGRWDHINIENAWMTPYSGGSPDQNAWALQFFGCDRTRIMDAEIASIAGPVRSNGVLFNNCYGACLEKIYIDGLKIAIEWLNTSNHIHILDGEIVNCTVGGIYSPSGANDANCVRGCYIEGNVDPIYLVSTTEAYTVIDGNYFNDNSGSADIQHYGRRSSIVNNQFLASSALTTIKVDGAHFDVSHNYSAGGTGTDYFLRFHTNASLSIAAYNHYDGTMPTGGLFIDASSAANNLAVFNRTNTGAYPDAVPAAAGGTGLTSYTTGDLLYASSAAALSKLAAVAAGRVLTSAGTSTAPAYSATPTLGVAGSTLGSLSMCGNVGGTVVLTPQANAGNPTLTLPNTTGTLAASAASPLSLNATTGQLSITGAALTKGDDTNVTLTLGGSPSAALVAAASITAGWTGTLGVARGGTNLASYTVGDLLYASGTTTLAQLAAVATGSVLASAGTGTAPTWSTSPTLTGLTLSGSSPGMTFAGTEGSAKSFYAGESAGAFYFKNITDTGGAVVFRNSANTDTAVFNGGGAIQFPNISTTASAANLYVDNGASNNLLRSTSSSRYKHDVVDISPADVAAALQLRPIQYRSLAQADDPDRQHLGLIAEEVAAVDKRLVAFDAAGRPDGVQYERVGVLLLGLLQQHEKRIAKLEGLHD